MKTTLLSALLILFLSLSAVAQIVIKVDSVLIGNSSGNNHLYGQTVLKNISPGSLSDSILVRDSLGLIKYLPGSSLGSAGGSFIKFEMKASLAAVDSADLTKRLISISNGPDEGLYLHTGTGLEKIITTDVGLSPRTARVNFTETGSPATSPNWNNFNVSTYFIPKALLDANGVTTGWNIVGYSSYVDFHSTPSTTPATTNFPLDIVNGLWWMNENNDLELTISGLNVAKTYDLNLSHPVEPGEDDYRVSTTVGHASTSTTHNLGAILASVEDTYTGLTPKPDGTITIAISTIDPNYWVLGGLIIKEN